VSRHRIGPWYRFAAVLLKPPLVVFFKRDWRGTEHIPENGGFITAVNHNSALDPLSYAHFQYNTGRVPRFLAKVSLFKGGFMGRAMRGTGQIPVFRESKDAIGAYRAAVEAINKGECVAFYPEGTLTRDPEMWPMKGKTGAARVALATQAPVIPFAQWGANLAVPPYPKRGDIRLFPRKTLTVQAGPPIDLSEFYGKEPTAAVLREVTERIMDEITVQLADIRQEPAPAERYDQRSLIDEPPDQLPHQQPDGQRTQAEKQPQKQTQKQTEKQPQKQPQKQTRKQTQAQKDTAPPEAAEGENA
jgi:1-acyl-sn-glycerol-3-phosphate acyltransferase